ncbi:MAG: bifunctional isocitrate dehydrogenase kinase/phosphatase, partial [Acidimicrobiia bacterium]|nr:bifunctional isocitrate dehydrogenase kinase/phosphatase [Acidimicrobiia bacterium]
AVRIDALERIDAYGLSLDQTIADLVAEGFDVVLDRGPWADARSLFRERHLEDPFGAVAETFFNSLARKMFTTEGIDPLLEFIDEPGEGWERPVVATRFDGPPATWLPDVATLCRFDRSWSDLGADLATIAARLPADVSHADVIDRLFFRGQAAYVVGSLTTSSGATPFALCIRHAASGGLRFAAVMVGEEDVSILFSYTRSAFHIASDRPSSLVRFVSGLLPHRSDSELWASIGYRKVAKSERYREVMSHLTRTDGRFSFAPGVPGLVMIVFGLPDHDLVFKVVRDRFPPPKSVTPSQVAERYQLVARHDRAGRLVEAQRFHDLSLPIERFADDVLEELLTSAGRTVTRHGDRVVFRTVYIERRVTPLDVYLRTADETEARRVIVDYGTAIKNLAASNIFPGDMLLKNFGVTSRGRVVFYDYDELTELTVCRFKELPDEDLGGMVAGVGPNDIFPEELPRFLGLAPDLRAAFDEHHADLFGVGFWRAVQQRIVSGERIEIRPYRRSASLRPEIHDRK